jgi:xanthine dehydrogenase YagS FAD-binding subunit
MNPADDERTLLSLQPELRAAGTDLSERRRSGISAGPIIQIEPSDEMLEITWRADGGLRIGSSVTIAGLAANDECRAGYAGLAAAAHGLATPQIRNVATVGGNLAQRSRCWYYRNPHLACLKKGDAVCPARQGNHLYGVNFDLGPCVAPHPSTLAAALMAYDALVTTSARSAISAETLMGDGSEGTRDNSLAPDEIIQLIDLAAPVAGERAAYQRVISRADAEWPLVEAVIRIVLSEGRVETMRIAIGGVAPVPLRLPGVEAMAAGQVLDARLIAAVARATTAGAEPLPMTGYKTPLLEGLIADMLRRLASGSRKL